VQQEVGRRRPGVGVGSFEKDGGRVDVGAGRAMNVNVHFWDLAEGSHGARTGERGGLVIVGGLEKVKTERETPAVFCSDPA